MTDNAVSIPVSNKTAWPKGLVIRTVAPTDATDIAAFHNLPGYRAGTLRLPYQSPEEVRRNAEGERAENISLVAVMDNIVVGDIGLVRFAGRRVHAAAVGMGVHDAYRRRGIGRALLGEIVAIADEWLDVRRLELTVFADNAAAIALYQSFGFETEGLHRGFAYRAGAYVDALAMARLRL